MRLVVSQSATDLIEERGGSLYVWMRKSHCCGGLMTLATASEPPSRKRFRRVDCDERFDLFLPVGLARLPDELELDAGRFPRRVEAFWDGCAWVSP